MSHSSSEKAKVFISYSHKDRKYLDRLLVHLAEFEQKGIIDIWSDIKIKPGAIWRQEIENAVKPAKVAVLLISADFLASRFITENELPPLLAAAKAKGTIIIPVILGPSGFKHTNLAQFQSINNPSNPIIRMNNHRREEIWEIVAETIREAILSEKSLQDERTGEKERKTQTQIEKQFHISYGPLPSSATIRTNTQFILLEARSGGIESYMIDIVKEVLDEIENISKIRNNFGFECKEFLMLRGVWFDDKHGSAELYIDLIHDESINPAFTEEQIKEMFHDGYIWYVHNQGISVESRIIKTRASSDGFFPTSSQYYKELGFLRQTKH